MLHQLACEGVMEDNIKSLTKVKTNNIHFSPFMHQTSHLIIETYQVFHAWFSLHKSNLTTPSHLLVLCLFTNGYQDYLLHPLPEEWGEVDLPAAPWPCPSGWRWCFLSSGLHQLPWIAISSTDNCKCHCPQHLWACPNRFERLGKFTAKWSLISPSSTDSKHPCSKLSCESQSLGFMEKLLSGTAFLMLFVTRRLPHSAESFSCHCSYGLKGGITTQ